MPWLAASPDRIVIDPSKKEKRQGCLEVKCPFSCKEKTILEATRNVSALCLIEQDRGLCLSESHAYYYQIQTEMRVTNSKWCDFVVWSPLDQPFVQRVRYNPEFMNKAIAKAQKIYFDKFLPAVLPYIILPSLVVNSPSACGSSMKKSLSSKATPLQGKTDSEKTSHSSEITLAKQPVLPSK